MYELPCVLMFLFPVLRLPELSQVLRDKYPVQKHEVNKIDLHIWHFSAIGLQ